MGPTAVTKDHCHGVQTPVLSGQHWPSGKSSSRRNSKKRPPRGTEHEFLCRIQRTICKKPPPESGGFNLRELERFPTNLAHRDGADFGRVQGSRREPCRRIVTDERRRNRPKGARPGGVDAGSPSDSVTLLGRATSPPCKRCLAERLPASITVIQIGRKTL